jgi:Transglycosylase SLT domain.
MIPHLTCMALAAVLNDLPPRALPAIHAVEGGAPGSVHWNTNGSADLGVMQINTLWLSALAGALGQPETEIRDRLVGDACFNIVVAGMK